jgi:hypothetical protein
MSVEPRPAGRRSQLIVPVLALAGFALTLRIFYPGVMTYDARYVYSYIAAGRAGDWQSPVMTALWALIDPIAPGPASMFLLIVSLYWLAFTVLALVVARRSLALAGVTVALALAPPAFVFAGIIWRDVLMATAWLLAAALAFAVADRKGRARLAVQALALVLIAFGYLLRPNALFAAPVLAAYVAWPSRFDLKRTALFYAPAAAAFYALVPLVYYGALDARHQHPLHAILVFDLGGISHFARENQFPVTWSAEQEALLTARCYRPTEWNIYWIDEPCKFVMARLEDEKIFGAPALTDVWRQAVMRHPIAYLEHRSAFMANFLAGENLAMWTVDVEHPDRIVFADNPWFMALKAVHDALTSTPLFRAGAWLLLCVVWIALAWPRRRAPPGAFVIGVAGSAVVYMATFFAVGVASDFRYALWAVLAGLAGATVIALPTLELRGAGAPKPYRPAAHIDASGDFKVIGIFR